MRCLAISVSIAHCCAPSCNARRIGPHVVFTLVFVDLLPKLQKPLGL